MGTEEPRHDVPVERPEGEADAPVEGTAPEASTGADPAIGLEDLEEELERTRDRLLRLQAEFDNFRKREARERSAAWARAKGDLVHKLLGVLDDLQRVADLDPETTSTAAVIEGVHMVERKLVDTLAREGLEPVGERGEPFDPEVHDAIATAPAQEPDQEGRVANVAVRGYRFGKRLLRPAHVQVYEQAEPGGS